MVLTIPHTSETHKIFSKSNPETSDPQNTEFSQFQAPRMKIMTHKQVEELIYKISQWAEIAPPKLTTDENNTAYATANIICLPSPITRTVLFVAHEMAHVINYKGKNRGLIAGK